MPISSHIRMKNNSEEHDTLPCRPRNGDIQRDFTRRNEGFPAILRSNISIPRTPRTLRHASVGPRTTRATPTRPARRLSSQPRSFISSSSPSPPKSRISLSRKSTTPYLSTALSYPSCLLFTAPHSIELYRAQIYPYERTRIHKRERFSAELCLRFAYFARQHLLFFGSFVVWDLSVAQKRDKSLCDPNYLRWTEAQRGPFYVQMSKWHERWRDVIPLLHVDVHGKKDRKHNLDLDLGLHSMEMEYSEDLAKSIRSKLSHKLNALFRPLGKIKNDMPFGVEIDPLLNGYWGENTWMTMSHQASRRKLASFQLELPYTMRKALMQSDELCSEFVRCICEVYCEVFSVSRAHLERKRDEMDKRMGGKILNFQQVYTRTMTVLQQHDKVDWKNQI